MQDQVAVGVAHRAAEVQQQSHPSAQIECAITTVLKQVLAFNQFHRIPEFTVLALAAVDQLGDMRVAQARNHVAFEQKALAARCVDLPRGNPLDGHALGEALGFALALGNDAHAAAAQLAHQGEGAQAGRQLCVALQLLAVALEATCFLAVQLHQLTYALGQRGLQAGDFHVKRSTVVSVDLQQAAEQRQRLAVEFELGVQGGRSRLEEG